MEVRKEDKNNIKINLRVDTDNFYITTMCARWKENGLTSGDTYLSIPKETAQELLSKLQEVLKEEEISISEN